MSNRLIALLTGNLEKGTEIKFDAFSNTSSKLIRPTPFYGYFPFDYQYSPLYELICVYQIGVAWLYGLYLGCTDTILTGFMIHIKAQLLILKNCINTFVERAVRKQVSTYKTVFSFLHTDHILSGRKREYCLCIEKNKFKMKFVM